VPATSVMRVTASRVKRWIDVPNRHPRVMQMAYAQKLDPGHLSVNVRRDIQEMASHANRLTIASPSNLVISTPHVPSPVPALTVVTATKATPTVSMGSATKWITVRFSLLYVINLPHVQKRDQARIYVVVIKAILAMASPVLR